MWKIFPNQFCVLKSSVTRLLQVLFWVQQTEIGWEKYETEEKNIKVSAEEKVSKVSSFKSKFKKLHAVLCSNQKEKH